MSDAPVQLIAAVAELRQQAKAEHGDALSVQMVEEAAQSLIIKSWPSVTAAFAAMLAALELAADYIKDFDGGDMTTETGWKSRDMLDAWLKVRAAIAKATGAA